MIRELLERERPDDGLVGEEGSRARAASGRRWIVDPLDGTVNFLYGLRAWGVSIALEDEDGLAVGVVFNPVSGECFAAERGMGATLNGEPIHVTDCGSLGRAMVATGFSYESERRAEQAQILVKLLPADTGPAPGGRGRARPRLRGSWSRGCVLRARPAALGRGRRAPARARGRRSDRGPGGRAPRRSPTPELVRAAPLLA